MVAKEIIAIFYYFNLVCTIPQLQDTLENFWKVTQPGELLRSLDAITSSSYHLIQPEQAVTVNEKSTLPKKYENNSRLKRQTDEDSVESLEVEKPYDYDKAYEEFVKKYFDDSVTDALSASGSAENTDIEQHDMVTYSGEELYSNENLEPVIEASEKSPKAEKCKNITRGQQNCFICKNLRNGETSESCSYNKESKPQNYKFEKHRNYRQYRATPINSENEKVSDFFPTVFNKPNDTLPCFMKKIRNKICYYCENNKGEQVKKCYAEEPMVIRKEINGYGKKIVKDHLVEQ